MTLYKQLKIHPKHQSTNKAHKPTLNTIARYSGSRYITCTFKH